jgi:F-type H+-transporting ATPase subunit delta
MSSESINTRYARAIFEIAQAERVVDRVDENLCRLRDLLIARGEILAFLKDRNIRHEGKRRALQDLFEGRVHPIVLDMLITISDQDRSRRILAIIEEYSGLAEAARERVSGEVVTAIPLDDQTVERMAKELSRIIGKNVRLIQKLDRSILGGAIVRVGEQVVDGSLLRKLQRMEDQIAS